MSSASPSILLVYNVPWPLPLCVWVSVHPATAPLSLSELLTAHSYTSLFLQTPLDSYHARFQHLVSCP